MKIIIRYIFLIAVMGLSFYAISSCNTDNPATTTAPYETDILKTDEFGNILGGDYSDWCLHNPVDTFTYVKYFYVTTQNNISALRWTTSKEYNCYGFDVERSVASDTNYSKLGFVHGTGITNDSVSYIYFDTLQINHPNYKYRLKIFDTFGKFKYLYEGGQITGFPPNAFFGPAYPNPTNGSYKVKFQVPRIDTVSLYLTGLTDTLNILNKQICYPGMYELNISNTSNFHNVQKRLHIKCGTILNADSCRLYGDIKFN
ncbi:MAG: hypothetical protein ACOYN6_03745 [Ignavibacteria bacterium]